MLFIYDVHVGIPGLIKKDMVKDGATVIDVGRFIEGGINF